MAIPRNENATGEVAASLVAERQLALMRRLPEGYINAAQSARLLSFVQWMQGRLRSPYSYDTTGAVAAIMGGLIQAERLLMRSDGGSHVR